MGQEFAAGGSGGGVRGATKMPKFLYEITHHHNSEKPDYKVVLGIPDGVDPKVNGLLFVILSEFGEDVAPGLVAKAMSEASGGDKVKLVLPTEQGCEDDPTWFTIWHAGDDSYGVGEGDAFDKYANAWVSVQPYVPDPQAKEQLSRLSKEQLLDLLLEVYAEGNLDLTAVAS